MKKMIIIISVSNDYKIDYNYGRGFHRYTILNEVKKEESPLYNWLFTYSIAITEDNRNEAHKKIVEYVYNDFVLSEEKLGKTPEKIKKLKENKLFSHCYRDEKLQKIIKNIS